MYKIKVKRTEVDMLMHAVVWNFDTWKDSKHHTQIDVIHCKWLKARDVLCSCHLQTMDLSYDVGRLQYGQWGMLLVHWMHVYVKVNLIML